MIFDFALLVFNLILSGLDHSDRPDVRDMTLVHEVRTATEEEVAKAAAEVPELLRRAQAAVEGARR